MIGPVGGPGRINRHRPRSMTVTLRCVRCDAREMEASVLVAEDGEIQHDTTGGCLSCGYLNVLPATDPELVQAVIDHICDFNLNGGR